jgi:hypothetical protein
MLGGCCGSVETVFWEQEADGQQAQVGSLRAGLSGEPKNSKGRVSGLRSRWNALLCVLGLIRVGDYCWVSYLGKKARMKIVRKIRVLRGLVSKGICVEDEWWHEFELTLARDVNNGGTFRFDTVGYIDHRGDLEVSRIVSRALEKYIRLNLFGL